MSNSCLIMSSALLPLQAVTRATGLSGHVLRAWEKRYGAIRPVRSESGQRRYTQADLHRLLLLRRATQAGHSIGTIAKRSDSEIRRLLAIPAAPERVVGTPDEEIREECLAAVRAMSATRLNRALDAASVRFGHQGMLLRVMAPLAEQIGELWRAGQITAAHEHFFTATARSFLGNTAQQFAPAIDAPVLIAATPAGQLHELGAFMAAVAAAHLGWRSVYLGASLPAAEIAAAARQVEAVALVLSIIHPPDDPRLAGELRAIRRHLPDIALFVGGRAADRYRPTLRKINARVVNDLAEFGDQLDALRAQRPPAKSATNGRR